MKKYESAKIRKSIAYVRVSEISDLLEYDFFICQKYYSKEKNNRPYIHNVISLKNN